MVITNAYAFVGDLHDRMPVILESDHFEPWLTGAAGIELLKPAADDVLRRWPVSKRVNSSRADAEEATLIACWQSYSSGRAPASQPAPALPQSAPLQSPPPAATVEAAAVRRPRNTNRWPLCGLRRSVSCTSSASPSKPLRTMQNGAPCCSMALYGAGATGEGHAMTGSPQRTRA
jgi:hypothetical protein